MKDLGISYRRKENNFLEHSGTMDHAPAFFQNKNKIKEM
jgi:hypothetical protein